MTETKLALRDVVKAYDDRRVLDGITLDVAACEVICLIGASGSGKSTLLRCVNLLEPVDDGEIRLDGVDIAEPGFDPDPVRRRVGMVFQSYNLFPHMTVLDNVTLAPRKVLRQARSEAERTARDLLDRFGLADKAATYPDRMSGGQQQRAAIVRALAMSPEILLLDEITSALDPELVREVLDVVLELKQHGMTMLIATHEMNFARRIADRVAFLERGRIHEIGSPQQIFEAPAEARTAEFIGRTLGRDDF